MQSDNLQRHGWKNATHDLKPVNVYEQAEQFRIAPRQIGVGTMRGTRNIGARGGLVLDSSNERVGVGRLEDRPDKFAAELNKDGITISDGPLDFISVTKDGFRVSDGTITFITLDKDGLLMNDGETNRVLLGKQTGGF